MPAVEGFTPMTLWTTIYGVLALCILFMIVYKVYDAIHTILERRKQRKESEKPDFAEAVSQKVIAKLEPRLKDIEKNLANDKRRLDDHESSIADIHQMQQETKEGLVAICKYLMAIAQCTTLGNDSKEMSAATKEMTQYLATKIGGNSK